jgi:hypothetical protein
MSTIPSLAQMKQGYAAYTTYKDLEDRAAATATSMGAAVSDACEAGGKSARGLYDKAVTTAPVHTPTQPASSTSSSNGWTTFTSWFNPNTPVPSHDAGAARAGDHAVNTPPAMETDPGHRSGTERRAQSQWEWEAEVAARTAATAAANEMALAMERAERACAAIDEGTSLNVTPSNGETNAGRTSVHAERVYTRTHVGPAHVAPTHVSYADLVFDALHHDYTADVHVSNISADECEPEVPAAVNSNGDETPADGTGEPPASIPGPECVDVEASEPPRPPPPAPGALADDESIDDSGPVEVDDGILASDPITEMEELRRKIAALESRGVAGSVET